MTNNLYQRLADQATNVASKNSYLLCTSEASGADWLRDYPDQTPPQPITLWNWTWQLAFFAGLRLVLLGGLAAVVSFCLRMFKSQIAIAQLNAHRTRVARSMPGLLEVAPERERLAVLQSLIQTIVGAKESILSDSHSESLLASFDALEKIVKAAKSGGE